MEFKRARILALLFSIFIPLVSGEIVYNYNGNEESLPLVQLFYEGYWQKVRRREWFEPAHFGNLSSRRC